MKVQFNKDNNGYTVDNNLFVPMDVDNRHYQMIQTWIAEGNVVIPHDSEDKETKLRQELDAIVGDLTPAESMYLMLQYGFAKMQPSDAEDDSGVSLTPTGEDIITWGDRVARELGQKLTELRELDK